ncbi:uncharacterized protein SPPG_05228 [Spizellomyces punctatus DAOM BR117]|uniref:CCDC92/74 N-terminal domain-containing protein n=1 Tax=Spizellomyces punctatus (strain DAOM BR117) TaxID=645134 RepID=A0A0L0HEG1_SPIPD|nr:uncharacterized protein SPPG_05228 [Spizellomyces punctatus DAOM BR117]KNC99855.1 hypothetical protein SPPG_05228 [Spizellomyces punctatus DAOM BR117]|eukprot:XP_016607895.1 hypothetical protein SPPG_05228 [Spizellomyces punctatus DAOM BR117]
MPAAVATTPLPVPLFHSGTEYSLPQHQQQQTGSGYAAGRILNQLGLSFQPMQETGIRATMTCCSVSSQAHARALAKITSLEKTIEFLQKEHAGVLKGLHSEITRLQSVCSDLSVRLVTKADGGDVHDPTTSKLQASVHTFDPKPSHNHPETQITGSSLPTDPSEPHLYLLLDQQKKKYTAFIDRLNEDNKRKQVEIDHLKAERELVQEALSVAGLQLDMKELYTLATHTVHSKASLRTKTKNHPLPPIGKGQGPIDREKDKGSETTQQEQQQVPPRPPAPTPPPTTGDTPRPSSRSRASKPVLPISTAAEQIVVEYSEALYELHVDDPPAYVSDPPPHTTWSKRMAGTKMVREKQWRDLKERL